MTYYFVLFGGKMRKWFEKRIWYPDYYRATDDTSFVLKHFIRDYLFQHRIRYILMFRKANTTKNQFVKFYCEIRLYLMCRKYGIEIKTNTKIG